MGEAAQSTKSINLFHSSLPQLFKKKRNKEIGAAFLPAANQKQTKQAEAKKS